MATQIHKLLPNSRFQPRLKFFVLRKNVLEMLRPTLPDRGQPAQRLLVQRLPDLAGLLHVLGHQQVTHQDRDLKEKYELQYNSIHICFISKFLS